jgi:hypothetical protein
LLSLPGQLNLAVTILSSSSSAHADDPVTTERPVWDYFASTCCGVITGRPHEAA